MTLKNLLLATIAIPMLFSCKKNEEISNPSPEGSTVQEEFYRVKQITQEYKSGKSTIFAVDKKWVFSYGGSG